MAVATCVACRGPAEPPLTYVEDTNGWPTGLVVCQRCLCADGPAGDDAEDAYSVEFGGEG
jgi:hypothetical protein